MIELPRAVRYFLAAIVGIASGLFFPGPGLLAPTGAVVVFVGVCVLLRCATALPTFVFACFIAAAPILFFAAGLSTHTPIGESVRKSIQGFASQLELVLAFCVVPFVVGGLMHYVLHRRSALNARLLP